MSRVSVVIPAYKAAGTIRRAVDSVLAQSHPAHEIIVVDDGSPDHQVEVLEQAYGELPQVIVVRQPNSKTAQARNTGLDHATGDLIAFLDADDYWEPEKLAIQVQVFKDHPEVGLVAGRSYTEQPGEPRYALPPPPRLKSLYDRVLTPRGERAFHLATVIWTGTVIIRREAIGSERFQSGLEPAEDRDFWVRIISKHPAFLLSIPLATVVIEEGSLSRSGIDRDCSNMLRVVDRHGTLLGWRGTRIWRSYTLFRWAANEPDPSKALPKLLASYWSWPLPYGGKTPCPRWGRMKRFAVLGAKMVGLSKRASEQGAVGKLRGEIRGQKADQG